MSDPYAPPEPAGPDEYTQNIAAAIADVSEKASNLVREEIELLKAELEQSARNALRGAIAGLAGGVFALMALVSFLFGCGYLLYYVLPGNDFTFFWGFFALAFILLVVGGIAFVVALRATKRIAPKPEMTLEEARKIREAMSAPPGVAPAPIPVASGPPVPPGPVAADATPPEDS